jgi:Phosphoglycerate dehydrogenase and related dehydrogenases
MLNALYLLDPVRQRVIYPESIDRELAAAGITFVAPPQSAASIRENPALLADVDVILTSWGMVRLDAELLSLAPRLRAVFHAAGSIRYFTTPEFWARHIVVSTAHRINAVPVAEYTLAAILFGLRRGWHYASTLRTSRHLWWQTDMPGSYHSTVALISLGAVGRLVRERLRPFDLRVIVHDPFLSPADAAALDIELVSLDEAFARADIVSLHTPLLPETQGLIRAPHFSAMKHGATFINTARGAVVRENEMIDVLLRRPDLHALLDVTDPEPPAPDSPLFDLPNVTLTPHIAGTCPAESPRLGRAMVDELLRWHRGEPLLFQVTEAQSAHLA